MAAGEGRPTLPDVDAGRWMERARAWLDELQTPAGLRASSAEGHYYAVFGRDTLWSLLLALEAARLRHADGDLARWSAALATQSLRALAATQGAADDPEIEEQPGKIVHEYWPEPPAHLLARGWPLRDGRYYGSVDATYLFLIAVAMVWEQVADGRQLVASLWDHVLAALRWALDEGDMDGDGLVEVCPRQPRGAGLRHHVWKDSDDSLIAADGTSPAPPVAWAELSAYALAAFRGLGVILAARGDNPALRGELERRAARIAERFGQFWLPKERCPAMALTREKTPIPLVSSNVGHVLWCGALPDQRAQAAAERLLLPDMLTAWGIRTLSSRSYAFAASSYHRGSVWPFDNAIAAAALWRMGRHEDARRIGRGVLAALQRFGTPVELYCVLPAARAHAPGRDDSEALTPYRNACAVQAWSAAAVLLFAAQLLADA